MINKLKEIASRVSKFITDVKDFISEYKIGEAALSDVISVAKVICVASLAIAIFNGLNTSRDLKSTSLNYQQVQQSIAAIGQEYRTTLVVDGYKRAELHSIALRDRITKTIELAYGNDKERLKEDLHSYITKNDINNTLYKIFHKEVFEYVDHWFNHRVDVRVIIADRRKILFSSATEEPFRTPDGVPELVFNYPYGEFLSCHGDDPSTLEAMHVDELVTDINRLENLVLIAPSYIYEHKDLLGVGDVYPDGTLIDNDKLAVVIAFKPITSEHIVVIRRIQDAINNNKVTEYSTILNDGFSMNIWWLILTVVSGAIWYLAELSYRKDETDDKQ